MKIRAANFLHSRKFYLTYWALKVEMALHTQTISRLLPTNCLSILDHFVGLALKGLRMACVPLICAVCPLSFKIPTRRNIFKSLIKMLWKWEKINTYHVLFTHFWHTFSGYSPSHRQIWKKKRKKTSIFLLKLTSFLHTWQMVGFLYEWMTNVCGISNLLTNRSNSAGLPAFPLHVALRSFEVGL